LEWSQCLFQVQRSDLLVAEGNVLPVLINPVTGDPDTTVLDIAEQQIVDL
jgi:hypothetical protein